MRLAHARDQRLVVGAQLGQHVERIDIVGVVVGDALEPRDVTGRVQRRAANLAHPLGDLVGDGEDLIALLVEQEVIIAEMRSAHMPMEVLGLEIEREHVGEQRIERSGDVAAGIVAEVGRRDERRLAALLDGGVLVHGGSPQFSPGERVEGALPANG
jgi:hypothetical protein